jgi:hypothetical protein
MDKRRRDRKRRANFSVGGQRVEDRDLGRASKQALGREQARRRRRAGRKTRLGQAPSEQRAQEPIVASSTVLAKEQPARDFARMNERKAPKQVKPVAEQHYLTDTARGMFRRMAQFARAPFAIARAVVDRFRDRD